jgi:hypothetical protein
MNFQKDMGIFFLVGGSILYILNISVGQTTMTDRKLFSFFRKSKSISA